MSERLEERLRRDLSSLEGIPVRSSSSMERAAHQAARRIERNRRLVGGTVAAVVVVGAVALFIATTGDDSTTVRVADTEATAVSVDEPTSVAEPETPVAETSASETSVPATSAVPTSESPTSTAPLPTTPLPTEVVPSSGSLVWAPIAPDPRGPLHNAAALWVDDEVVVVGGEIGLSEPVLVPAAYDPATNSWRLLHQNIDTLGRTNTLAVWTGHELFVVGGEALGGRAPLPGVDTVAPAEAYNPAEDTWRVVPSPPGTVSERSPWAINGIELYVWPSTAPGSTDPVGPVAYDPTTNEWRPLSAPPIEPRERAASVWTGTEWIVWGGTNGVVDLGDGAAYNPASDTWRIIAPSLLSSRRANGVWTGQELLIVGGSTAGDPISDDQSVALADGAAYNPAMDQWRAIASGPAHPGFIPVWTGAQLMVFAKGAGAVYDLATDSWTEWCCNESGGGVGGAPVWTGSNVILIGADTSMAGGAIFAPPA